LKRPASIGLKIQIREILDFPLSIKAGMITPSTMLAGESSDMEVAPVGGRTGLCQAPELAPKTLP
jgi:hypothetical protein